MTLEVKGRNMFKLLSHIGIWLLGACFVVFAASAGAQQISSTQQNGVLPLSEQQSQSAELHASLQATDNGVLFVLSNSGAETLNILRWETPLEAELTQDVFQVTSAIDGKLGVLAGPAQYSGRLIKRGEPQAKDFFQIQSGESVSAVVPIADYYQLAEDGLYNVSFNGAFNIQSASKDRSILSLESTSVTQTISTESVVVNLVSSPEVAYARVGGYNSCSVDQQAEIALDINASETITRDARQALEGLPENERAGSPRYLHWFGLYSETRYNTVLDIYRKAEQIMADGTAEFNCDCNDQFYAYVFPLDPFKIYLCNFYWPAPRTGTDSKAGTILHELSHFPEVGDTDDNAYGAADVARLADNTPNGAVNNADSIEYFAENTPFREISAGIAGPVESIQYTTLPLGNAVFGNIATGDYAYFQVTGANYVELTSTSPATEGDADIIIYASALLDGEICSENTTGVDRCELDGASTVYIAVLGYAATDYTIIANEQTVVQPETGPIDEPITVVPPPNDPNSGSGGGSSGGGQFAGWFGLSLAVLLFRRRRVALKRSGAVL